MDIEGAKKAAATMAVDEIIKNSTTIGIGSGSTIVYAVARIAQLSQSNSLKPTCIPTSFQAHQLITEHGLPLGSLNSIPKVDVTIDGADEISPELNLIKGGGGCHLQEKLIAFNSTKMVVIADYRKNSSILGENWQKGIPMEVIPMGYVAVMGKIAQMGGQPKLRMAQSKLGPCISDNGNFIVDANFGKITDPKDLDQRLKMIPGVIETGLFINGLSANIVAAFIGMADGSVNKISKP